MPRVACIVLAAGGSRRMGEPKQLLSWNGQSLVAHAVAQARASLAERVFVVLGAAADEVGAALEEQGAERVSNADWESGLASSIRVGVRAALSAEAREGVRWDGLLLALADQPDVSQSLLDALIRRFSGEGAIVACAYAGALGVPALFGRAHFGDLCALEGDLGAKRLLAAHADDALRVTFDGGATDIDTPDDYRALLARPAAGKEPASGQEEG